MYYKKGLAMLDGDRIRIEHIDSDMEVLTIPDELPVTLFDIQGRSYTRILPVSELGKKACYEKKNLKQVRLGKNFRFLDDYAFARCEHLTEVVAEGIDGFADLRLGNGVFDDCGSLEILALDGDREAKIARLLAAVPRFLKAEDLLTGGEIGTDAWYERWDFALRAFFEGRRCCGLHAGSAFWQAEVRRPGSVHCLCAGGKARIVQTAVGIRRRIAGICPETV